MRILIPILCACMAIGCTKNVQPERHGVMSHPTQSVKYRIGVSQNSYDDWREKLNDEILREMIFHDDVKVEILSADDNSEKQIEDIRYFMDADFDIIIASPREAVALTPIITTAYKKGIPVVLFDRKVNGENYTAYMGADNRRIGEVAGQYILSRLGHRGRIMEIKDLKTPPLPMTAMRECLMPYQRVKMWNSLLPLMPTGHRKEQTGLRIRC